MYKNTSPKNNSMLGLIIVLVGIGWLLNRMNFVFFPHWIFSWPMILIAIGLLIGVRKNFQDSSWLILILLGGIFLFQDLMYFDWEIRRYVWPVAIIVLGIFILIRGLNRSSNLRGSTQRTYSGESAQSSSEMSEGSEERINIASVLGGIKRKVFSKNFKGGQVTSLLGGTDLDLSQADISGTVLIDTHEIFGGLKLIVPSNWEVRSEVTNILGGIDDKRSGGTLSPGKILVITGFCMFGGIEIKTHS